MMNFLEGSFVARFFVWLAECSKYSLFAQIGRFFARSYKNSRLKVLLTAYITRIDPTEISRYGKVINKLGTMVERLCAAFKNAWRCSYIGKASAFSYKTGLSGRLVGWAVKIGFRRWAVIALALYVALDWLLRDIIQINFIASFWDEALFLLLAIYVTFCRGNEPQMYKKRTTSLEMYILLFCAAGFFLMCVVSPNMSIAVSGYRAVVQYMLWFIVLIRLLKDASDYKLFFVVLASLSAVMCLHGIYQFIVATPIPSSWVTSTESSVRTRVFSITGSPNIFGSFIVMTAPIAAGLVYSEKTVKKKLLWFAALAAMCLAVLFTFSRGAWVGAAVAVAVFALLVDGRLIALLGAGVASVLVLVPSITNRIIFLFTPEFRAASNAGGRSMRWTAGMRILNTSNPALGFGLGRFGGAVAMQNQVLDSVAGYEYFYLDNYYLKTLVEMGYVGILFYAVLLLNFLIWGIRAVFRLRDEDDYAVAAGIYAGLCGVLVHCCFENIFEVPYMQAYFWMLAAALIFRAFRCKKIKI